MLKPQTVVVLLLFLSNKSYFQTFAQSFKPRVNQWSRCVDALLVKRVLYGRVRADALLTAF